MKETEFTEVKEIEIECNDECMALEYLEKKNPDHYCAFHMIRNGYMVMNMVKMCDEDKNELMKLIEENEYDTLSELLEETKLNWLIKALNGERPAMYDERVYYSCGIEIIDLGAAPEEQVQKDTIYLTPEIYTRLLIWKMSHRTTSFNYLAIDEPEVYEKVLNQVGEEDFTCKRYPKGFFIRLTEIEEDVDRISGGK